MIGKTISHYKIEKKLGEGGMGVVYKAQDTKLKRAVALKFLASNLIGSGDEKKRFILEAQAAAALTHANIAHIYEIDDSEDQTFIAMEFIEGRSLHEMLERPLPLEEAIDCAIQISAGMQAAHEKGVVHRDIKSANIMVTEKGVCKIMDFGLAKLSGRTMVTKEGTTLGTASYMSPEQARGQTTDNRSDIWSLGVVLYEMISGELPFKGDYEQAVIYAILNEEPQPLTAVRTGVPQALDGVVAKALAKDPKIRYQHVDELPADLAAIQANVDQMSRTAIRTGPIPVSSVSPKGTGNFKRFLPTLLVGIGMLLLGFAISRFLSEPDLAANAPVKFSVPIDDLGDIWRGLAISPDGQSIAYVGIGGVVTQNSSPVLRLRRMDEFAFRIVPGLEDAFVQKPFFSPDGQWLGFYDSGVDQLMKIAVGGGLPQVICELDNMFGAHWGANDVIIIGSRGGLLQVPATGGTAETVVEMTAEADAKMPFVLPGETHLLFDTNNPDRSGSDVKIASLIDRSVKPRVLIENATQPLYTQTGHILYIQADALMAVPFDLERLEITGAAKMLYESLGVARQIGTKVAVADGGSLMYLSGAGQRLRSFVWVDPTGATEPVGMPKQNHLVDPNISPSGDRLVFAFTEGGSQNIWTWDLNRKVRSRITNADRTDMAPVWTPDGQAILFSTERSLLMRKAADGSGTEDSLYYLGSSLTWPFSWSQDGRNLAVASSQRIDLIEVALLGQGDLRIEGEAIEYLSGDHALGQPQFSPDGRWLAYTSNESGQWEIYVRPLTSSVPRWQASNNGGWKPRWSDDSRELYYRQEDKMMVVKIRLEPEFSAAEPGVLFEGDYVHIGAAMDYDVAPDGRFLMIHEADSEAGQINVMVNWFDELKRLVPTEQ